MGLSVAVFEWRNGETSLHTSSFGLDMRIEIGSVSMLPMAFKGDGQLSDWTWF